MIAANPGLWSKIAAAFLLLFLLSAADIQRTREINPQEQDIIDAAAEESGEETPEKKLFRVVIDAGHGGEETGAGVKGVYEKNINLSVAEILARKINDSHERIEAYLTRESDISVSPDDRAGFANNKKAILYLSVHCDNVPAADVSGYKIYYPRGDQQQEQEQDISMKEWEKAHLYFINESKKAAIYIMQYMQTVISSGETEGGSSVLPIPLRGEQAVRSSVLKGMEMPAVLIELGNINNPIDVSYLKDRGTQDIIARHIAEGVFNYIHDGFLQYEDYAEEADEYSGADEASPGEDGGGALYE